MSAAALDDPTAPATTDARRWVTLGIVLMSTVIVVLDNTVLQVAIPTILDDFHTTLPSLQWVITGYSLTFATFLIIGGRLGDLYGTRRVFVIGAALFGLGSLLASESWNVASLVVGEAIIEGLGASLMLPATISLLSNTFQGKERAMAFAAWGAVAGSAVGLGPLVGGLLTTNFSWRWSFRINVIIAPLAVIGALIFIAKSAKKDQREPLDGPGAAMIAVGMFLFVFGLSEGGSYGWITPIESFRIGGWNAWPASYPVSIVPVTILLSVAVLSVFYRYERSRERQDRSPLFEFGMLRQRTFRWGLLTSLVLSIGQLGMILALALFLQESLQLSALRNGVWMLPFGIMVLLGAPTGGRLARYVSTVWVIRVGLVVQSTGIIIVTAVLSTSTTFLQLLPGLALYGLGIGLSLSQLTNIVLSAIPPERSGVASGTNTTVRQIGTAIGIAVIGTVLTTRTVHEATVAVRGTAALSGPAKAQAIAQIHAAGANFRPTGANAPVLEAIKTNAVATGTHQALLISVAAVILGALLSCLIPSANVTVDESVAEELIGLTPIDSSAIID